VKDRSDNGQLYGRTFVGTPPTAQVPFQVPIISKLTTSRDNGPSFYRQLTTHVLANSPTTSSYKAELGGRKLHAIEIWPELLAASR